MDAVLSFFLAVMGILGGTAIVITWLGIRYAERKHGLRKGASESELKRLREELAAIRQELQALRESQADLTLMLHDSPKLPPREE